MFNSNKLLHKINKDNKQRDCNTRNSFGNNLRDEILQQQIFTDVAANIVASPISDGTGYTIMLKSKKGNCIGEAAKIICSAEGDKKLNDVMFTTITGVSPSGEQTLLFKFSNGEQLTCNVSDLYNKLKTMQTQVTETAANLNTISTTLTHEDERITNLAARVTTAETLLVPLPPDEPDPQTAYHLVYANGQIFWQHLS